VQSCVAVEYQNRAPTAKHKGILNRQLSEYPKVGHVRFGEYWEIVDHIHQRQLRVKLRAVMLVSTILVDPKISPLKA
jgi:hypothetical protein